MAKATMSAPFHATDLEELWQNVKDQNWWNAAKKAVHILDHFLNPSGGLMAPQHMTEEEGKKLDTILADLKSRCQSQRLAMNSGGSGTADAATGSGGKGTRIDATGGSGKELPNRAPEATTNKNMADATGSTAKGDKPKELGKTDTKGGEKLTFEESKSQQNKSLAPEDTRPASTNPETGEQKYQGPEYGSLEEKSAKLGVGEVLPPKAVDSREYRMVGAGMSIVEIFTIIEAVVNIIQRWRNNRGG